MPLLQLFPLAAATGITAHLGFFIRGEWHIQAPLLAVLHIVAPILIYLFQVQKKSPIPLIDTTAIIAGYLLGLFSSLTTYRLSPFHRLHKFPGPKMAAVTKFWHVWQCRDSRNHEMMERLCKEYEGDFVRIGMAETYCYQMTRTIANISQCFRSERIGLVPSRFLCDLGGVWEPMHEI
jgi:hypothetical protein